MSLTMVVIPPSFALWLQMNDDKLGLARNAGGYVDIQTGVGFTVSEMTVRINATEPKPKIEWLVRLVIAYEVVQEQWNDDRGVVLEVSYRVDPKKTDQDI